MLDYFFDFANGGSSLKPAGYIAIAVLLILFFVLIALIKPNKSKKTFSTKQLVFCAVCMALAFVLSYIKLFKMPLGGSVTLLSMFFITLIGYFYGPTIGIISAVSYGFLQLFAEPFVISPLQLVFDYILAFGALGLSGFFSKSKYGLIKGYLFAVLGRWVFASLSGYFFFKKSTPEGWHPIAYTVSYNGSYIAAEAAITIIVLLIPAVSLGIKQVKQMATE